MKSCTDFEKARNTSTKHDPSTRRRRDAAQDFQQSAFACAVTPDDPEDLATLHLKIDILKCPEFLSSVTLNDRPTTSQIERLPRKISGFAHNHITQRRISFSLGSPVSNQVTFGKIFDGDDCLRHWSH